METQLFHRSTHLVRDQDSESILRSIILTSSLLRTIDTIVNKIQDESGDNAFAIVGPYGSGKSTTALLLHELLTGNLPADISENLRLKGILLANAYTLNKTYTLVGENTSLNESLRQAFRLKSIDKLIPLLEKMIRSGERIGIVIDEMGKFLEYAAEFPSEGDVYILQQIAELAHRSNGKLVVVTIRHQGLLNYLSKLPTAYLNEWKKIQGRFHDLVHINSIDESIQILYDKFKQLHLPQYTSDLNELAALEHNNQLSEVTTQNILNKNYGISPTLLLLIISFFKKHGQNERSIFTFLSSAAKGSVRSILNAETAAVYQVDHFYSFISNNFEHSILESTDADAWGKIKATRTFAKSTVDFTDKAQEALFNNLIVSIGMLTLLGEDVDLISDVNTLSYLNPSYEKATIESAIEHLSSKQVVTFRGINDSYALWHGSTIDVSDRIQILLDEEYRDYNLADQLNQFFPHESMVARRVFVETGAFRTADWRYVSELDDLSGLKTISDAIVACLIGVDGDAFKLHQPTEVPDGLVLLCQNVSRKELGFISEYLACKKLLSSDKEINSDRNAREELLTRLSYLNDTIHGYLSWNNKTVVHNEKYLVWTGNTWESLGPSDSINSIISSSISQKYPNSPRILNELINTDAPSSSAMSGLRVFLTALFSNPNAQNLGIETTGPEYAIYLNVLKESGLHHQNHGLWRIGLEEDDPATIRPVWDFLEHEMTLWRGDGKPLSLLELENKLAKAPFGVKRGLAKILIFAKYVEHREELSLYEEGTFTPDIYKDTLERMLKLPRKFSTVYVPQNEAHKEFLINLASIFGERLANPSILSVVSIIIRYASSLPYYTKHTQSMGEVSRGFIKTVLRATSPEALLFSDIPEVFDIQRTTETDIIEKHQKTYLSSLEDITKEINRCYPALQERCCALISKLWSGDEHTDIQSARVALQLRVSDEINDIITEDSIRAFYNRVNDKQLDDEAWLVSVTSLLANHPLEKWHDDHFLLFEAELRRKQYQVEELYRFKRSSINKYTRKKDIAQIAHRIQEMIENSNVPMDEIDTLLEVLNNHYKDIEKIYNE